MVKKKNYEAMSSPCNHFVASSFSKDDEYMQWLRQIKEQYRRSQAKAAVRVNDAMIEF